MLRSRSKSALDLVGRLWSAEGAAVAALAEARSLLAGAHRLLARRRYWERVARRFPPSGIEPEALDAQLDGILREGTRTPGQPNRVEPLTGLRIAHGHSFYGGHWLGPVPAALEASWQALAGGDGSVSYAPLVESGLAAAGPPRVDADAFSLVVVPHCDDAALAVGGTLASRLSSERPVVVEVFTVSNWQGTGLRPRTTAQVTPIRRREEARSVALLGGRSLGLGFWDVDGRTRQRGACEGYAIPEEFRWEMDPKLRSTEEVERITSALRTIATRLAPRRIYLPLGIGGHADHSLVAALAASMLPFFAATAPEVLFYEDQPYAAKVGAEKVAAAASATGKEPELVDISATFETKLQAVAAHRSQFARAAIEPPLRGYAEGLAPGLQVERLWRPR